MLGGLFIVNDIEIAALRTSQKHKSDFYSFSKCNFLCRLL